MSEEDFYDDHFVIAGHNEDSGRHWSQCLTGGAGDATARWEHPSEGSPPGSRTRLAASTGRCPQRRRPAGTAVGVREPSARNPGRQVPTFLLGRDLSHRLPASRGRGRGPRTPATELSPVAGAWDCPEALTTPNRYRRRGFHCSPRVTDLLVGRSRLASSSQAHASLGCALLTGTAGHLPRGRQPWPSRIAWTHRVLRHSGGRPRRHTLLLRCRRLGGRRSVARGGDPGPLRVHPRMGGPTRRSHRTDGRRAHLRPPRRGPCGTTGLAGRGRGRVRDPLRQRPNRSAPDRPRRRHPRRRVRTPRPSMDGLVQPRAIGRLQGQHPAEGGPPAPGTRNPPGSPGRPDPSRSRGRSSSRTSPRSGSSRHPEAACGSFVPRSTGAHVVRDRHGPRPRRAARTALTSTSGTSGSRRPPLGWSTTVALSRVEVDAARVHSGSGAELAASPRPLCH